MHFRSSLLCRSALVALLSLPAVAQAQSTESPAETSTEVTADAAQEARNLALVTAFYEGVFLRHEVEASAEVVADSYIQHNPNVPDGKAPFVGYFTDLFAKNPEAKSVIQRSAASGDLVWLHVHSTANAEDPGRAIVDIFRVEDDMIVEHWDVIQQVPTEAANDNGMF